MAKSKNLELYFRDFCNECELADVYLQTDEYETTDKDGYIHNHVEHVISCRHLNACIAWASEKHA